MSPCWLTQGHASKAPLTNQSAHGLLRLLAANIMEIITFSCSSHESDKWDKEQRSESKMAAMKCRLCLCSRSPEKGVNWHRIFFFFFFFELFKHLGRLNPNTITHQFIFDSTLWVSNRQKFLSSNLFLFFWTVAWSYLIPHCSFRLQLGPAGPPFYNPSRLRFSVQKCVK